MRNKKYFLNILIILLIGGTSIYLSIGEQFDQVLLSFQEAKISWIVIMGLIMFSYYLLEMLFRFGILEKHINRIILLNNHL